MYYVKSDDNKTLTLYNVKPGTYTVTLSAQYYDDLSTDFTMAGTVVKNPVPNMDIQQSVEGGVYTVKFFGVTDSTTGKPTDTQIGTWKLAINKISVNGTNYTEYSSFSGDPANDSTEYKWGYGQGSEKVLILGGSAFKTGENKVVISAKGYEDLTVTINKSAETVTEKDAPFLSVAENGVIKDGNSYKITLTGTDLADWWKNVKKVQVDEDTAADISKVTGETALMLSGLEANHEYTLTFTADGYKNATIKVKTPEKKSDNNETAVTMPTTAPTVTKTRDDYYNSYYELKFTDAAAWLKTVTGITFNGNAVSKLEQLYFGNGSGYYIDAENNVIAIVLSTSSTAQDLVISAENDKNLTLSVKSGAHWDDPPVITIKESSPSGGDNNNSGSNNGNSGTETPSTVTVPTTAPIMEKEGDTYKFTFTGSTEWVDAVEKVMIGDTVCTKETSISNLKPNYYCKNVVNGTINIQFSSEFSSVDYTVVLSSEDGSNALKLKVTVPGIFGGSAAVEIIK